MGMRPRPFMNYVSPEPNSGCWLWIGGLNSSGYGKIRHKGKMQRAHRISYELHYGSIPPGMQVCHRCDVRSCVNPDHLFMGSDLDNAKDREAKGRGNQPKGRSNAWAKLTEQQVIEIRAKKANGQTARSIAREYGIAHSSVLNIYHGKKWKHVSG